MNQPDKAKRKFQLKSLSTSAFGLSVIIHSCLILFVGSTVIFKDVIPKAPFLEVPVGIDVDMPVLEEPPEVEEEMQTPSSDSISELQPSASQGPSSSEPDPSTFLPMDTIVSSLPSTTYNVPTPGTVSLKGLGVGGGDEGGQASGGGSSSKSRGPGKIRTTGLFGGSENSTDGLIGTFYDLKQTSSRSPTEMMTAEGVTREVDEKANLAYRTALGDFVNKGWNTAALDNFYKAPKNLVGYQFWMSGTSSLAPEAFDVEKQVKPNRWAVHYKGRVTAPKTTSIRFVGRGDNVLVVRFKNATVLDASLTGCSEVKSEKVQKDSLAVWLGDWINIREGETYPMEILIGDFGGGFAFQLMVEEKGVAYTKDPKSTLNMLPLFQTAPTKVPPQAGKDYLALEPFSFLGGG